MVGEIDAQRILDAIYADRHRRISRVGGLSFLALAMGAATAFLAMHETLPSDRPGQAAAEGLRWMASGILGAFATLMLVAWRRGHSLAAELVFQIDCAALLLVCGAGVALAYLMSFPRIPVMAELSMIGASLCLGAVLVRIAAASLAKGIQARSETEAEAIRSARPRPRPAGRVLAHAA